MVECQLQFGVLNAQMDKFNCENAADKKTFHETIQEYHEMYQQQQLDFHKRMDDVMAFFQRHLSQTKAPPPRGEDRALDMHNNENRNHLPRGPYIRLDVPHFDGNDPYNWVFKIKEYFEYHQTPEDQRIQIVSFHLYGFNGLSITPCWAPQCGLNLCTKLNSDLVHLTLKTMRQN